MCHRRHVICTFGTSPHPASSQQDLDHRSSWLWRLATAVRDEQTFEQLVPDPFRRHLGLDSLCFMSNRIPLSPSFSVDLSDETDVIILPRQANVGSVQPLRFQALTSFCSAACGVTGLLTCTSCDIVSTFRVPSPTIGPLVTLICLYSSKKHFASRR
jgi:hypothetical protein